MNWLKKLFWDKRYLITCAELNFKYVTTSGYVIGVDVLDIQIEDEKIIVDDVSFVGILQVRDKIENLEEIKKRANKISKILLKEARSNNKIEDIKHGCYVNGKHIVKCFWEVDFDSIKFKSIPYEKWEKMKK